MLLFMDVPLFEVNLSPFPIIGLLFECFPPPTPPIFCWPSQHPSVTRNFQTASGYSKQFFAPYLQAAYQEIDEDGSGSVTLGQP